ncbi:MAG: class I SAM-dependent methyltransferase [Acidimicrobiales bacterium]
MTSDSLLAAQYRRRFEAEQAGRAAVWRVLVDAWFSRYLGTAEAVLDLGCGWGAFINQVAAPERYGIDLNDDASRHVDDGVVLFRQSAADPWPLPDRSLDLVFTSNFLEHLPSRDAIIAALREALRCVRPGGRIVCLGPDIRYAKGDYWNFFDHVIPLTARSLAEALELAGFRCDDVIDRFLPYTLAGRRPPPSWAIRAYLRLRPAWRLLGRQFLVVGAKPESAATPTA